MDYISTHLHHTAGSVHMWIDRHVSFRNVHFHRPLGHPGWLVNCCEEFCHAAMSSTLGNPRSAGPAPAGWIPQDPRAPSLLYMLPVIHCSSQLQLHALLIVHQWNLWLYLHINSEFWVAFILMLQVNLKIVDYKARFVSWHSVYLCIQACTSVCDTCLQALVNCQTHCAAHTNCATPVSTKSRSLVFLWLFLSHGHSSPAALPNLLLIG